MLGMTRITLDHEAGSFLSENFKISLGAYGNMLIENLSSFLICTIYTVQAGVHFLISCSLIKKK